MKTNKSVLVKHRNIFSTLFKPTLRDRAELVELLHDAANNGIIENDSIPIIEAVLHMDNLKAKDIMLPRHQMDVLDINDSMESIVNKIIQTGHSRLPVIDGEISNILGIFHSKDLISYFLQKEEFNLREQLRQVYFVPEIKHLDGLMFEMRVRQSHMAIVVDEFTNIVGLVTLEMIVEQIVGEIEDEHDLIDSEREIIEINPGQYRLKGYCKIAQLNQLLNLAWVDSSVETVGGFLIKFLSRIPVVGEILEFDNLRVEIINSDSRKINLLTITLK